MQVRSFLFVLVGLLSFAVGCEQLGISASKDKSSDEDDDGDDDDDDDEGKKKKKKKKKKKRKKKKKGDDDDDDDDDDEEDDDDDDEKASKPSPSPAPAPASGSADCDAYLKTLDCMMSKVPEESRAQYKQMRDQLEQTLKLPAAAAQCKSMAASLQKGAAAMGCGKGAPASPTPVPVTPPPAPATACAGPKVIPDIPATRSDPPTLTEWASACEVNTVGAGSEAPDCTSKVKREWLKLTCTGDVLGYELMDGFGVEGQDYFKQITQGNLISFVVRMRKGRSQKVRMCRKKNRGSVFVSWPPSAPKPTIIALQAGPKCDGSSWGSR